MYLWYHGQSSWVFWCRRVGCRGGLFCKYWRIVCSFSFCGSMCNVPIYIKEIIIFHKLVPGEESLQIHFSSRSLFFDIREPTPRPPYFLSRITSLHWILHKDFFLVLPHHKKRLWMDERSLPTPFGILNTDIKYIGRELRTLLIRHRLPAMLSNLPFHIWSLLQNFSITGFHVEIRDGLAPVACRDICLEGSLICRK